VAPLRASRGQRPERGSYFATGNRRDHQSRFRCHFRVAI